MAKVPFSKLGLSKNQQTTVINYNGQDIEVKQYLPINDKLNLISAVINNSHDDNNFANPVKVSVFAAIEVVEAYTNINFTDKQKEDPCKLFDLFHGNDLIHQIYNAIPVEELNMVMTGIQDSIEAFYKYRNSVMGILDAVSEDYSNLDLDATEIWKKLGDPNNMAFLKEVTTKLD